MNPRQLMANPEWLATRTAWEQRLTPPFKGALHLKGSARSGTTDMYDDPEQRVREALDDLAPHGEMCQDHLENYLNTMPDKLYYVHPCDGMPLPRIEQLAETHPIVICADPTTIQNNGSHS